MSNYLLNFMSVECECGWKGIIPAPWSVLYDKDMKCECGKNWYTVRKSNKDEVSNSEKHKSDDLR